MKKLLGYVIVLAFMPFTALGSIWYVARTMFIAGYQATQDFDEAG